MIRTLAYILLFTPLHLLAQKSNTILAGIGSSGYYAGIQQQYHPKFSYGFSVQYLYAKPNFTTVFANEEVRINTRLNTPQASFTLKFKPFGKISGKKITGQSFYLFTGAALRMNPNYDLSFTFKDPLEIGTFVLTPEQTGSVNIRVSTQMLQQYMGAGGEFRIKKSRFSIHTEAGVMYHGTPTLEMHSTGTLHLNDLNEAQLQKNISSMKILPWANIMLGIKI
jgi:hypothetical protein